MEPQPTIDWPDFGVPDDLTAVEACDARYKRAIVKNRLNDNSESQMAKSLTKSREQTATSGDGLHHGFRPNP